MSFIKKMQRVRRPIAQVNAYWQDGAWHVLPAKTSIFDLKAHHRSQAGGPVIAATASAEHGRGGRIARWSHHFYRFAVDGSGTVEGPVFCAGDMIAAFGRELKAYVEGDPVPPAPEVKLVKQQFKAAPAMQRALEAIARPLVLRRFRGERPHGVIYLSFV